MREEALAEKGRKLSSLEAVGEEKEEGEGEAKVTTMLENNGKEEGGDGKVEEVRKE